MESSPNDSLVSQLSHFFVKTILPLSSTQIARDLVQLDHVFQPFITWDHQKSSANIHVFEIQPNHHKARLQTPDPHQITISAVDLRISVYNLASPRPSKDINSHQLERRPLHTEELPKPSAISLRFCSLQYDSPLSNDLNSHQLEERSLQTKKLPKPSPISLHTTVHLFSCLPSA